MRLFRFSGLTGWKNTLRELALIVAGVMIALGGNSWWQNRQDRQTERVELQQLLKLTLENRHLVDSAIWIDSLSLANAYKLEELAAGTGPLPRGDSVSAWFLQAWWFSDFHPLIEPYRAISQGDAFNIIQNADLRQRILKFAGSLDGSTQELRAVSETGVIVPLSDLFAEAIGWDHPILSYPTYQRLPDSIRHIPPRNYASIRSNPALQKFAIRKIYVAWNRISFLRPLRPQMDTMIAALSAELRISDSSRPSSMTTKP